MRKDENRNYVTPLFIVFAVVMFTMAFISLRYSIVAFLIEFLLAAAAMLIVILSIVNLKKYLSGILSSSMKRLFKEESRSIDDIRIHDNRIVRYKGQPFSPSTFHRRTKIIGIWCFFLCHEYPADFISEPSKSEKSVCHHPACPKNKF